MRIAIVAGEASGDLLGATLIHAVLERWPEAEFYGIAGPRMVAQGARTFVPMEKLSVFGYLEVLRHIPEILGIRRRLAAELLARPPDLFIGVDAPDFNFGLETKLKAAGIPTIHYVSPSIWAWRAERIHAIKRAVERMLVMFPFEEPIYRAAGIPVSYVGHPLADAMPVHPNYHDTRTQLRIAAGAVGIAMLPGSRMKELELHADLFIDAMARLHAQRPELRFFVPLATRETRDYFETRLYVKEARDLPIQILHGHARLALHAADAAIVASGTATLEAALARCPMVITYRLTALTYRMLRRKALLPYVGLPNVLAGEFIVPELLQDDATPANLAQALGNWLDHKGARERLKERFGRLHAMLACDHSRRIIEALAPYLDRAPQSAVPSHRDDGRRAPVRG
jgi:lipid-A-disaccharide synthase